MKNWPTFSLIRLWFQVPQRTFTEAAAAFFAEAVAVTSDRYDMAMVKQAIEDRRCDDNIAEDGTHTPTALFEVISIAPRS